MPAAIPALLIAFGALMRWVMPWALRLAYGVTIGVVLANLADVVGAAPWPVSRLEGPIRGLDSAIEDGLATYARINEAAFAEVLDGAAFLVEQTGDTIVREAQRTWESIQLLVGVVIPGQVKAETRPLAQRFSAQTQIENQRARGEALARTRGIDALDRDLMQERLARERGIDYLAGRLNTVVIPRLDGLAARLDSWAGYTWRNLRALRRRVGLLEVALGAGAVAAIATRVLTRALPWWRCSNVRSFNKAVCRSPLRSFGQWAGLLGLVELLALDVIVASDLCKFIDAMSAAAKKLQPLLLEFVDIEDALIAEGCGTKPALLPIAPLGIPLVSSPPALNL